MLSALLPLILVFILNAPVLSPVLSLYGPDLPRYILFDRLAVPDYNHDVVRAGTHILVNRWLSKSLPIAPFNHCAVSGG